MTVNDDGSVNLATSCVDIGSGSTTALTQIAAEVLGLKSNGSIPSLEIRKPAPWAGDQGPARNTAIGGWRLKKRRKTPGARS